MDTPDGEQVLQSFSPPGGTGDICGKDLTDPDTENSVDLYELSLPVAFSSNMICGVNVVSIARNTDISKNDVVLTSMRRHDVASTSIRRHFGTICPLSNYPRAFIAIKYSLDTLPTFHLHFNIGFLKQLISQSKLLGTRKLL